MISAGHIEKAIKLMSSGGANYAYFFNNINTPEWIEPLWERGFFQNPPAVTPDSTPHWWPESRYLVRMAAEDPELVLRVIDGVPATDNFFVRKDMIQAALKMPADCAAQLAGRVKVYMRGKLPQMYVEDLCELAVHLLKGGKVEAGIDVAREILDVSAKEVEGEALHHGYFRNVQGRIDGHFG